jgi:putative DNA primase/helicase
MNELIFLYQKLRFVLAPCNPDQKHPYIPEWQKLEQASAAQLEKWFKNPKINVAIITGEKSGIFVLDIDNKNGATGSLSLQLLEEEFGKLPQTPTVLTPNNGIHYYFKYPQNTKIATKAGIKPGLDIRGDSGLVIAPPSEIAGKKYLWELSSSLEEIPLADAPGWLLNLAKEQNNSIKISEPFDYNEKTIIPKGQQDNVLSATVMSLLAKGIPEKHIKDIHASMLEKCEQDPNKPFDKEKTFKRHLSGAKRKVSKITKITLHSMALQIIEKYKLKYSSEKTYYQYKNGYYQEILKPQIVKFCTDTFGNLGDRALNQIRTFIESESFTDYSKFDSEDILNLENGLFNLETMKFTPGHFEGHLSTLRVPITYDPTAQCPRFLQVVNDVFEGQEEFMNTLLEFFGSCLTRKNFEKALLLIGDGNNGKTVLTDTICSLFNAQQVANVAMGSLNQDTYLALLDKAYLNIVSELNVTERIADGVLKDIIGGGIRKVAQKYKLPVTVKFRCKLIYAMNNFPSIADNSFGLSRRLLILPFNVDFSEPGKGGIEKEILMRELNKEKSGIFNCLIWALGNLKTRGYFKKYESLDRVKDENTKESHPIYDFFDEYTFFVSPGSELFENTYESITTLFLVYKAFSEKYYKSAYASNPKWFARTALQFFGKKIKLTRKYLNGKRNRVILGVKLNSDIPGDLKKYLDGSKFWGVV